MLVTLLLIALLRVWIAPKDTLRLSPFLTSDLYFNEEIQQILSHIILGQVQKAFQEYGNNILPSPSQTQSLFNTTKRSWLTKNLKGRVPREPTSA